MYMCDCVYRMPPKRSLESKSSVSEEEFQIEDDYGSLPPSPQQLEPEVSCS